jgi:hypothetical protein
MKHDWIDVYGLADSKAYLNIQVPPELREAFAAMVHRAANLWPDAPAAIKEFADMVTEGKIQQDYQKQVPSPKVPVPTDASEYNKHPRYLDLCSNCGSGMWSHTIMKDTAICDRQLHSEHQQRMADPDFAENFTKTGQTPIPHRPVSAK